MGKVEGLRQAQLWLMLEGSRRRVAVAGAGDAEKPEHLPPCYRAGFVLNGDWR